MGQEQKGIEKITDDLAINTNRKIGSGAYGTLYQGYDQKLKKIVAVKCIEKTKENEQKREEKILQKLKEINHKHIMKYYRTIQSTTSLQFQNSFFIVLELYRGQNLRKKLEQGISELQTLRIFNQIVLGMEEMHKLNIIHRDLKPDNIILDINNNVKIVDFGIAREISTTMTKGVGTLLYSAPEIYGHSFLDSEKTYKSSGCDVWSAGIILHEMLTGCYPVKKETKVEIFVPEKSKWYTLLKNMLSFSEQSRVSFAKIKKILEEKQFKKQIFEKYGYEYAQNQKKKQVKENKQSKSEEEANSISLRFERSLETLKLSAIYLHFIKEKYFFYKQVIQEIKKNQTFVISSSIKIFINYLMILSLIKENQKFKKSIESNEIQIPFGKISEQSFEQNDYQEFIELLKFHRISIEEDIKYWRNKTEHNFLQNIKKAHEYQKKKGEKSLETLQKELSLIQKIDLPIQKISLNLIRQCLKSICNLKQFDGLSSNKDMKTFAYILIVKNMEKEVPNQKFVEKGFVIEKKKSIENLSQNNLLELIKKLRKK